MNTVSTDDDNKKSIKNIIQNKSMLIVLSVGFIILLFVSSILVYNDELKKIEDYNDSVTKYIAEELEINLENLRYHIEHDIYNNLKSIALNIENDIKSLDNLDEIEEQLNEGIISDELRDIFKKNISGVYLTEYKNDDSDIFICNSEGIIADFTLSDATTEDIQRTWEYEINKQYNTTLAENTVQDLLNQTTDCILVFEKKQSTNSDHMKITQMTAENIEFILKNEGIEGLKNYIFLVPVYITDTGDVFGKEDIVAGHRQHTNKFIVVQEYRLYDHLSKYSYIYSKELKNLQTEYNQILISGKIFGISVVIAILCSLFFIMIITNKHWFLKDKE